MALWFAIGALPTLPAYRATSEMLLETRLSSPHTSSFFRIWNTNKLVNTTVAATLKRLVATSKAITRLGSGFLALLDSVERHTLVRLHVLTRKVLTPPEGTRTATGSYYKTTDQSLAMYANHARALVEILADPVLREELSNRLLFK